MIKVIHTPSENRLHSKQASSTIDDMKEAIKILRRDPNKIYDLHDFLESKFMPWARSSRSIRKFIESDMIGANILKAEISGRSSRRRYAVKGENIISYLEIYGPTLMRTARKYKTNG